MRNWVYSLGIRAKDAFLTMRGWKTFFINAFAFFGVISAIVQFLSAIYANNFSFGNPLLVLSLTAIASFLFGVFRAFPKIHIHHTYSDIDVTIEVMVGDVLSDKGHIVIGFTDTFDTNAINDEIINSQTLQGKLQTSWFNDDLRYIDKQLQKSLQNQQIVATERQRDKPKGKLARYAIGTVAILKPKNNSSRQVYALAYSRMGNDLVAESSVHYLWDSIGQLWEAVYKHGQRKPIAMPILGTGLARINALDRESLLRMLLLSFMARSREKLVCKKLTIYIHPSDLHYINMLELEAFIKHI